MGGTDAAEIYEGGTADTNGLGNGITGGFELRGGGCNCAIGAPRGAPSAGLFGLLLVGILGHRQRRRVKRRSSGAGPVGVRG